MEGVKYLSLNLLFFVKETQASLASWWRLRRKCKGLSSQSEEQFVREKFDEYLDILKPIIYRSDVISRLAHNPQYQVFTDMLTEEQLKRLLARYRETTQSDVFAKLQALDIQVGAPPQGAQLLTSVQQLMVERLRDPLHKMKVLETPTNPERALWNITLPIQPITISGEIIHGKGIGAKQLGLPTANLWNSSSINAKLLQYPSAIYVVRAKLRGHWYRGAMSIGTNPQVEDSEERKLEVYLCHAFEKDFYGEHMEVIIERLLRFELKFPSFDCFLHSMHNDIDVIRSLPLH